MMENKDSNFGQKVDPFHSPEGIHLEIEKKYLLKKTQVELLEKRCLEISLPLISNQYEKNQNFDRDDVFDKDDARLRLRTKIQDSNEQKKNFEFTYKKRISIVNGVKKETELNFNFSSDQPSENLLAIFKIIGLSERDSYERKRKTFSNHEIQLTVDEFPFGYIVELEGEEAIVLKYEKLLNMDNLVQYGASCDDVYKELCRTQGREIKAHIIFGDKDMPNLEDYVESQKNT